MKKIISLVMAAAMVLPCTFMSTNINIHRAYAAQADFVRGADVGWLPQMEESGFAFKNDDGEEQDCLEILKEHGIDSIRLRTWVDPSDDPQAGHCSAEETVEMAKRANDMGFKIMIDFHYSDSWADPAKQYIPKAWENYNLEEMTDAVYNYTKEVMEMLEDEGVTPEWVQVGNEINPGMLLPIGSATTPENLAQLINAGYDAVKEVSPDSQVIIHRAEGANNAEFRKLFDKLEANGAKYDVIGASYYPEGEYTDSIDDLGDNLNDMVSRYDKDVMVVEVGADCVWNETSSYNMLVAVQKEVEEVKDGRGLGVFYWEPQGAKSWSGYSLSAWNGYVGNDNDGMPTKALDAFIPGAEQINENPVTGIELDKSEASVEIGSTVTLSPTLSPSNATYKGVKFTSSDESIAKVSEASGIVTGIAPGTVTITVESYDGHKTAECEVTVVASTNLINNPGFELDSESWDITGDAGAVTFENDKHEGHKALHYYNGDFEVSQTITGLENGTYKLSAWTSGGGEEKLTEIFALNSKGERYAEPFINTGWSIWNQYEINDIEVTDGKITIGAKVEMNESGGQWGNIDEFELVKISSSSSKPSSGGSHKHEHSSGNSDEDTSVDLDETVDNSTVVDKEEEIEAPTVSEDKVLPQGWNQIEGSWYMVNSNGEKVKGWHKDGAGWTYLSTVDGTMKTGWILDNMNWYYLKSNGYMQTGWVLDRGNWYYLRDNGEMASGWILDRGAWYYLNNSGAMQTNWIKDGDNWYYCNADGTMAADTVVDGYAVGSNGAWIF